MSSGFSDFRNFLLPQIEIVTPQKGSRVASGLARPGFPSSAGSDFVITLVALPGQAPILVKEGPAGGGAPPGPNPNFPGLVLTFNRDLVTPGGGVIRAGTNLAALFQFSGSEKRGNVALTTFSWLVGGSLLQLPTTLTIRATITDSLGFVSPTATLTVGIIPGISGDSLTPNPAA